MVSGLDQYGMARWRRACNVRKFGRGTGLAGDRMSTSCDLVAEDMGAGVAAAMTAVDCIASEVSEEAFLRLSEGPMGTVLPILLTFFVAFFGISLVLGRSNLSLRGVIPKMVTIGLVTAFATSFVIFQQFFYNIFVLGPDWLAGALTGRRWSSCRRSPSCRSLAE